MLEELADQLAEDAQAAYRMDTPLPTLAELIRRRGWQEHDPAVRGVFVRRHGGADWYAAFCERYEAEAAARDATADRATQRHAEALAAPMRRELGDRLTLPRSVVTAWTADAENFGSALAAAEAGQDARGRQVDAGPGTRARLAAAQHTISHRQLRDFSVPELRALYAVFHVFATEGDDGTFFRSEKERVSLTTLCEAAGVDPRQGRGRRALVCALDRLASVRRTTWVKVQHEDEPERFTLIAVEDPLVKVRPVWERRTNGEITALTLEWEYREPGQWADRLPDSFLLELPDHARRVFGALFLNADVLERLEQGARAVRGSRGLVPMDFALLMELTQTRQAKAVEATVGSFKSYVNRADFLSSFHGRERVEELNAQRHAARLREAFEQSAEVLKAGGLVVDWKPETPSRAGARDVFVLAADVVLGTGERVRRALKPKRQKGRKRRQGQG